MEALVTRARFAPFLLALVGVSPAFTMAASHRTENFVVTAATKDLAVEIAEAAEDYRAKLAVEWLGRELPRWADPCPIRAKVAPTLGAGGATSFLFETHEHQYARPMNHRSGDGLFRAKPVGRPFGWEMTIQGSRERVLDSVLPHEVTHTIFATHFGRPLPRWADEGACTTVEHPAEKAKQHRMLYEFLTTDRGIAFNRMFSMNEYPPDILPLYSQGFSLARFLIAQGGKRKFVKYIEDGLNSNNWTDSTREHYGFTSLSELQVTWLDWVREGSPKIAGRNGRPQENGNSPATLFASRNSSPSSARVDQRSPATDSWYVSRSRVAKDNAMQNGKMRPARTAQAQNVRGVKPKFDSMGKNNWTALNRVASRPEPKLRQKEVLLEWGKPTPFLTPQIAGTSNTRFR